MVVLLLLLLLLQLCCYAVVCVCVSLSVPCVCLAPQTIAYSVPVTMSSSLLVLLLPADACQEHGEKGGRSAMLAKPKAVLLQQSQRQHGWRLTTADFASFDEMTTSS